MEVLMAFGTSISLAGFIAQFTKIKWNGIKRGEVDVTHMASPDGWKEFDPSALKDAGGLDIEIHFDPDTEPPIDQAKASVVVTWPVPAGMTNGASWTCDGFLTELEIEGELDGKLVATAKAKFSGKPTFAAAS